MTQQGVNQYLGCAGMWFLLALSRMDLYPLFTDFVQSTSSMQIPKGNELLTQTRGRTRRDEFLVCPRLNPVSGTYVMLFWCSVSSAVLRSSVVALLSMFLKRSMAEMFLWMLCLGRSSFDTNVSVPPSSQRNSMGQQSWP